MSEILDNVKHFIEQEVEIFGDGFALEKSPGTEGQATSLALEIEKWKQAESLADFDEIINNCSKCPLAKQRNNFVFGEGDPKADILIVGEAPGADEDRMGRPFVGAAGKLLDKILAAINLSRHEVFICNILKCHPPQNRDPLPEEIAQCQPYLMKQIELVQPKIILCLGRFAAQTLLQTTNSLGSLRGRFFDFCESKLIVTYHPAALLRNPEYKRPTWDDVQLLQKEYLEFKSKAN